jgi:hypothetical protein
MPAGTDWAYLITIGYGQTSWEKQTQGGRAGGVDEPDAALARADPVDDLAAGLGARAFEGWLYHAGKWSGCPAVWTKKGPAQEELFIEAAAGEVFVAASD